MREVSLWLVYGTQVWQGLLVLAGVAGVAASWLLIDRAMRARAARVREALGAALGKITAQDAGKELVVTGKIVAGSVDQKTTDEATRDGQPALATVVPQGFEQAEEATGKAVSGVLLGKKLELDVGGTRVTVDAPLQLLCGSHETERCMAPETARAMLWDFAAQLGKLPSKPVAIRTVSFGETVRVRGVLQHEPDYSSAEDYRSAPGLFSLVLPRETSDTDADARYVPVAFEGSPRPLARRPLRMGARAVAFPLGALMLLGVIGEIAIRVGSPAGGFVAALTPFRRADGLTRLRDQLDLSARTDERRLARAVELDLLRARCGDAADVLYQHGSAEASARTAKACGDGWRAGRAFASVADFQRAADSFHAARAASPHTPPSLTEATAYLATGKYAESAAAVRELARAWEGGKADRDRLECAAEAIEARAGNPKALEALAGRKSQHPSCTVMLADLLHGQDRRRALDELPSWYPEPSVTNYVATAQLLDLEEAEKPLSDGWACRYRNYQSFIHCDHHSGRYFDVDEAAALYLDPRRNTFAAPAGLVEPALARLGQDGRAITLHNRARLTFSLVLLDSFLGRVDEARRRLGGLKDETTAFLKGVAHDPSKRARWHEHRQRMDRLQWAEPRDTAAHERALAEEETRGKAIGFDPEADEKHQVAEWVFGKVTAFEAALGARAFERVEVPKDKPAFPGWELEMFVGGRSGDAASVSQLARRDPREANARLWDLLRAGDGAALAERLRAKSLDGRGVIENARAATGGKEELANWLRWSYPAACSTCGVYPLANRTASRLDAALALQNGEVETEERAIAQRLHELLHRRDIAIPLAILSELSPP